MMRNAKLFVKFLEEYLENVKRVLPQSYRARQLEAGGTPRQLVFEFEEKFLLEPFMKALESRYSIEELEKIANNKEWSKYYDHFGWQEVIDYIKDNPKIIKKILERD